MKRKTRAALIGSGGFTPILNLFLETVKIWQDEVDRIYIAIDSSNTLDNYIKEKCKQFPKITLLEGCRGWPDSYNDAFNESKEDLFLILHDDTLIYEKGIVAKYFKLAEEGFVCTPMHGIYQPEDIINEYIHRKYGWNNPPYSFLLYFLFISRENLLKTDINFNGKGWEPGEVVNELNITAPVGMSGDTGFLLGLQLFDKKVSLHEIPRSETSGLTQTDDALEVLEQWQKDSSQIFEYGWFHLQNTGNTIPNWFKEDLDKKEWNGKIEEVRLAWFYLMLCLMDKEAEKYWKVFRAVALKCKIEYARIETMASIFNNLLFGGNTI